MGNSASSGPSIQGTDTETIRKKSLKETLPSRNIINNIFKYISNNISIRDFYKMSSSEGCSKYILLMTNSLDKYFYKIKIRPVQESGTISFRKITELTKGRDKETQSLCLSIAYFYTRILQIYGALAITMKDNEIMPSSISYGNRYIHNQTLPGQLRIGGNHDQNLINALGNFRIFYLFIKEKIDSSCYRLANGNLKLCEIKKSSPAIHNAKIQFVVQYKNTNYILNVEISAESISGLFIPGIKLTFKDVKIYNSPHVLVGSDAIQREVGMGSFEFKPLKDSAYVYKYQGIDLSPLDVLEQIIPKISKLSQNALKNKKHVEFTTTDNSVSTNVGVQAGTSTGVSRLDISDMVKLLTDHKAPYCVARALQLINTQPFEKNKNFTTNICNVKFVPIVPEPNKSLSKVPGLVLLENLFYDEMDSSATQPSKRLQMSASSSHQHQILMSKLNQLFNKTELKDKNLQTIINRIDKEECGNLLGRSLTVKEQQFKKTTEIVKQIYKFQYDHSNKCIEILKELFSITDNGISIHPNVFKGGIIEVNRISNKARTLLSQYYTNCENLYSQGFNMVKEGVQS